jgi:23S rRNA (guanosine2251-2'-O)-methyltransferase
MDDTHDTIIYGQHAVASLLDTAPQRVLEVWLQDGRDNRLSRRLHARYASGAIALHVLPRARLDALLGDVRHQGVAVRAARGEAVDLDRLLAGVGPHTLLVLLDGVQDPRNLGAVLRSADGAGAGAVIVPRSRGVALTPAARKTASGAADSVPVVEVANLARAMSALTAVGVRLLGTADDAPRSVFETDLTGPLALVLGAEDAGLRRLTRERCDALMQIPMHGRVASLNVAVAAGVCLYEALRQRTRRRDPDSAS